MVKNYHISLVAITSREIYICIPLNDDKSCIYRKKPEYSVYYLLFVILNNPE